MPNQVSDALQDNALRIMQMWEERVRIEINASTGHSSLVLQNALPKYLQQLVNELSTRIRRSPSRAAIDKAESARIGAEHGHGRAGYVDYSMDQLIFEYHILRQVIFEVLEEEAPLEVLERDIIICSIEQAVNDAATQFAQTLRDIQELFMVTLTHDLRAPITTVKMGTHLIMHRLEHGNLHVDDLTAKIIGALSRMDSMIQNLLDASQLRSGQNLEFEFALCDLESLVREVVEELRFVYGERFVVVSGGCCTSSCDRKEIQRVLENLAINAVKYGASHTPITFTLQQNERQCSITVHNEGEPINLTAQSILFQKFRRDTSDKGKTGWGLGLFLVKNIVEAHQGEIDIESEESKGTSFIVRLPKAPLVAE